MAFVYILYSPKNDTFYIGATTVSVEERLHRHLEHYYENKFTAGINDWEIFFQTQCATIQQSMLIERHIKKMKSKTYIRNLKKFPEIIEKLKIKYNCI